MERQIERLRVELRHKVFGIERHLHELQLDKSPAPQETIGQIKEQLTRLGQRIDLQKVRTRKAEVEVLRWIERRSHPEQTAPQPGTPAPTPDVASIQRRFAEAENYASAALDLALAAIDNAEYAALNALSLEQEVYAHMPEPGPPP